jgi:phosphate starvation-inducible PhoH-like protein
MTFDDNRLASALFGQYGQNLASIERRLGVIADSRGNQVTIEGSREACEQARRVLDGLYEQLKRGVELTTGDVEGAIRLAISQGSLFDFDPETSRRNFEEINLRKRTVRARTPGQDAYLRALKRWPLVFGPPGPARPGSPSPMRCSCSSARKSTASFFRVRRWRRASGSGSCRATCGKRSIPICARSTTRCST